MVQWTVISKRDVNSEGLAEFLAKNIAGEWIEDTGVSQRVFRFRSEDQEREQISWPMARALAEYLVVRTERIWLLDTLDRRYRSFGEDETEKILCDVGEILHSDREHDQDRLDLATTLIFGLLQENTTLVLEGIRTFLLPDIQAEYEEAIDRAVDVFLMEEEYQEFVKLLKQLVAVAGTQHDWIHVRFEGDRFFFEDPAGKRLGDDLLGDMLSGNDHHKEPIDDVLISALVTLAPKRITLHRGQLLPEGMHTLKEVFDDRVLNCPGCGRCYSRQLDSDRRSF